MGHQAGALPERTKYKKGTWPERAKYNNGFAKITFVVAWFPPPSPHAWLVLGGRWLGRWADGPLTWPLGPWLSLWAPQWAPGPLADWLGAPSKGPWALGWAAGLLNGPLGPWPPDWAPGPLWLSGASWVHLPKVEKPTMAT